MPYSLPDLPGQTFGGLQFWTDHRITRDGWRVQRHSLTGHCRLVDAQHWRRAVGSYEECAAALEKRVAPALPQPAEAVVLLHGLGRTRHAMDPLATYLQHEGYDAFNLGYASTRGDVDQHAAALADVVAALPQYERVHLVAHSLGNLVVRRYFRLHGRSGVNWGRMVMLAPPNQGSRLATRLSTLPIARHLFHNVLGRSGRAIADWHALPESLASVTEMPVEVGIIAGHFKPLQNPFIGEGDLIVSVTETRLEGALHLQVAGNHTLLMRDPAVLRATASFLHTGHLVPQVTSLQ